MKTRFIRVSEMDPEKIRAMAEYNKSTVGEGSSIIGEMVFIILLLFVGLLVMGVMDMATRISSTVCNIEITQPSKTIVQMRCMDLNATYLPQILKSMREES